MNIEKLKAREYRKKDNARFGGLKNVIYERDGYKCVRCHMTMENHIKIYGKRLTINHINGLGRNSNSPDNRLDNLETLCLPCHGKFDGPRWMNTVNVRLHHPCNR